jgi:hypothetical protein
MARKPRVHYPWALYHVILRGNGGQTIFFDDKDRTHFYFLAQEGIERFGHPIHAFCLITTHVHMAIQVGDVSLSRILAESEFSLYPEGQLASEPVCTLMEFGKVAYHYQREGAMVKKRIAEIRRRLRR